MTTTRYWTDGKEKIFSASGELKENGDFTYDGHFGLNTIYSGNHYETELDAANALIKDIDEEIRALEVQKTRIAGKYLYKTWQPL
jgi:hypothetical protein